MLYPIEPLSFVITSIAPIHLTESTAQIFLIVSFVDITTSPSKNSVPVLFILQVLSFVLITVSSSFLPHAVPLPQTISEASFEVAAVSPIVLSVSIWFSTSVLSLVKIPICKFLCALSVFQASFEVSFITISIDPNMDSIAFCLPHSPLTNIAIAFHSSPHA